MKSLVAVLSLITLACNIALASGQSVTYCVEKITGEICSVSSEKSAAPSEEDCCPFDQARSLAAYPLPFECDHCTDYEVEVGDEEAAPAIDRIVVKAAEITGILPVETFAIRSELRAIKAFDTRGPPCEAPKASRLYTKTIQLRV